MDRVLSEPWLPLAGAWLVAIGLASAAAPMIGVLVLLGFGGAFVAGLVGVGGAILMIPLLLYVPPAMGLSALDIHTVAGITIVQVAAAAVAGLGGHRSHVDRRLLAAVGAPMIAGSLVGGVLSAEMDPIILRGAFATLATLAAASMLGRRGELPEWSIQRPVRLIAAAGVGAGVGLLAGLVGAGGGFILIPLLVHGLRVPLRTAIGTSLAIVAGSALAGLTGKAATGQIDWTLAAALVVGALPGGRAGAWISSRTRQRWLAVLLGIVTAAVGVRMWLDISGLR